jgi:hypothetical protein
VIGGGGGIQVSTSFLHVIRRGGGHSGKF